MPGPRRPLKKKKEYVPKWQQALAWHHLYSILICTFKHVNPAEATRVKQERVPEKSSVGQRGGWGGGCGDSGCALNFLYSGPIPTNYSLHWLGLRNRRLTVINVGRPPEPAPAEGIMAGEKLKTSVYQFRRRPLMRAGQMTRGWPSLSKHEHELVCCCCCFSPFFFYFTAPLLLLSSRR